MSDAQHTPMVKPFEFLLLQTSGNNLKREVWIWQEWIFLIVSHWGMKEEELFCRVMIYAKTIAQKLYK